REELPAEAIDPKKYRGIWLGAQVPVVDALAIIRTARKYLSYLDYIDLSDWDREAPEYIHHQIFLGGATETARRKRLSSLTDQDFETLYTLQNQRQIHEFLRTFR
ncbi:MAG TPA: hypothetical protein DCE41_12515, partial [Cytophagales bacterium]|nr:hypothetical protein [Cytophagales bacterium]